MTSTLDTLLQNIQNTPKAKIVFRNDYMLGTQDRVFLYVAPEEGIYSLRELNEFQNNILGSIRPELKGEFRIDYLDQFFSGLGFFEKLKKGLKPGFASFEEKVDVELTTKTSTDYEMKSNDSHLNNERLAKMYSAEIKNNKVYFSREEENSSSKQYFSRLIHLDLSPNSEIIEESIKKWIDEGSKEKGYNLSLPWAIRLSDLPEKMIK